MQIRILSVGKARDPMYKEALDEFMKRLRPLMRLELQVFKDDKLLLAALDKESNICLLDERGMQETSEDFSSRLFSKGQWTFVIGAADGLPKVLKESMHPKISLSRMTLPHQMVRLILVEQIYRASEIHRGSAYHKD